MKYLIAALLLTTQPLFAELTPIMPQQFGNVQPIPLNNTTNSPTVLEKWGNQMDSLQVQRGNPVYQYQPSIPTYQPYQYRPLNELNDWVRQ